MNNKVSLRDTGIDKKKLAVEKEIHLLMANRDKFEKIEEILAGNKLPMLVKIAAALYNQDNIFGKYRECDLSDMISYVLGERRRRLNADFKWTDENKARFLLINDQLYDACVKGWNEAVNTATVLEKRIKQKDSFLKDYEIEITLNAYPKISGERKSAEIVRS